MKIQREQFAAIASALALVVSGLVGVQPAAASGTVTTQPAFTITGNQVAVDSGTGVWTSGAVVNQFFACTAAVATAVTTPTATTGQPSQPQPANCFPLVLQGSEFTGGSLDSPNLGGLNPSPQYVKAYVTYPHVTLVSWNKDENQYVMAASQSFAPTIGSETSPTLSLSGNTVTRSDGGFTGNWGVVNRLYACPSAVPNAVTTPTAPGSLVNGCRALFTTNQEDGQPSSYVAATDLTAAFVNAGGPTRAAYNSATHGSHILALVATGVAGATTSFSDWPNALILSTASMEIGASSSQVVTTPYTGPVVNAPGALKPVAPGAKVVLPGSNLTGVSKATINGKDAAVKVNSAGELEIVVPKDLAVGTYDLVVTSDSGVLTVQDAIRVQTAPNGIKGEATDVSTKLKEDNTVKVYVTNVVGAGKVQIFLNGKEIAWVNTDNPDDAKLLNEYLVRTLELSEGKNVIEIYVNLKRVDRKAYTLVDDSSKI
jgi:hypothetical protein